MNGEADGLSDPGNELLPCFVITDAGAKADDVFQGQRRISRRFWEHLAFVISSQNRRVGSQDNSSGNGSCAPVGLQDWMMSIPCACKILSSCQAVICGGRNRLGPDCGPVSLVAYGLFH